MSDAAPTSQSVTVPFPSELLERIDAQAAREDRKRSGMIRQLCERGLTVVAGSGTVSPASVSATGTASRPGYRKPVAGGDATKEGSEAWKRANSGSKEGRERIRAWQADQEKF